MSKPIQQYVYLLPQRDNTGTVSWNWLYNGNAGSAANFPTIDANNGKNDIYFTIVDPQNQIKFAGHQTNDINQAVYLSPKGSPTAKQPGINVDKKDFDGVYMLNGGLQVHLGDANGNAKDFVYQLNFVDSLQGNQKVTGIDPEIRNGDGSNRFTEAAIYVGAALIGALLTVMFVRFALGWRNVAR